MMRTDIKQRPSFTAVCRNILSGRRFSDTGKITVALMLTLLCLLLFRVNSYANGLLPSSSDLTALAEETMAGQDTASSYGLPEGSAGVSSEAEESDRLGTRQHVYDAAGLLTGTEQSYLEESLSAISQRYAFDTVVATVSALEGEDIVAVADDFFDYGGFGYGENRDGILFLMSIGDRQWYISTSGYGYEVFTDSRLEYMEGIIVPYLSRGNYAGAFNNFATLCEETLEHGIDYGESDYTDYSYQEEERGMTPAKGGIAAAIGALFASLTGAGLKRQLKSVKQKNTASDYIRPGSFNLYDTKDIFLYDNVTRVRRPKQQPSSGGRSSHHSGGFGGHSTTHRSSSGRTHGGRGGGF